MTNEDSCRLRIHMRRAIAVVGVGMCLAASGTLAQSARDRQAPGDATLDNDGVVTGPTAQAAAGVDKEAQADRAKSPLDYVDNQGIERTSVLVYLDRNLPPQAAQRAQVRRFANTVGGTVRYEYTTAMPNVLNLRDVPVARVAQLKRLPGVTRVEKDVYHPDLVKLDESTPLVRALQSQLTAAGLPYDGTGVRVCVCDTGIDMDHIMYSARIDTAASYDFANNDTNPDDDHGHGSHVSGIAVGRTGLTVDLGCEGVEPFQGIAPNATLIGAKILNAAGGGTDSDIIAGIDHCADQSPSGGRADVINLSIGTGNYAGICTHSWAVAANNAVANGVVVVAASGNEHNSNSMGSPACGVDVIAVGATYKDNYPNCENSTSSFNWGSCTDSSPARDSIVCFSNQSDYLDVAAPGSVIMSASNAAGGTSTTSMSGTSMASPMVAGLAALILDADPSLTPAQVRQIIRDGAIDMGTPGFDRAYGYGRIDAINSLQLITPCSIDPECDDGLWCNGAETCNAGSCLSGSDPCPGQSCDEVTDSCVASPTMQIEWNMNTNPGWTTQGLWAWGSPSGGGGQHGGPDPTGGATGSSVYGYNLSGDYENNLAETHLTTTAIDCTNFADVSVKFQRWLGVEQPTYDHAYFRVSTNGSTWTTLWQNGAEVADTAWSQQTFDLSAVADGQPTVYLRWTLGTTDSSWQYCGWNVDDVQIWARSTGGGCTSDPECDDGLWCNGAETCVGSVCQAGSAPNCNDGVGCTDDSCNEATDSCDNVANNGNCDDGLWCNGGETCHATLDCQAGSAPNCNDGVGCTDDSCNEATDSCNNVTNNGNCDDGLWCNGGETCHATLDCQAGSAPNCNDGVGCTDDSCNEATDSCDNVTNNGNCDDGLWCNGAETCHATLDCQAGSAPNCNDGVGCTDDSCNETTDSCDNVANNANCDDGLWCNGAETCNATLDCQAGGDPCPGQLCDEPTDTCVNCAVDGDCDDGVYCNGAETCAGGSCQIGTAVDCNDGVGCTTDSCNEGTDSCDNVANNAVCDDGLFCNGAETCSVTLDCQAGSDPCPGLTCDEGTDSCVGGGCVIDADCDDGIACTIDTCSAGVCSNVCAGGVSSFPYTESFTSGFGLWSNVSGDVFDWTRRSGSTPSSSTGPSGDHTTGSSFYVYTETSSPRVSGDTAILEGPCMDLSGASSATLTFWYHMYGASMGTLQAEVSTDCTTWTNVFSMSGNKGNTWFQATVDLTPEAGSSSVKIRFRGIRGSSWQGDSAIDDIVVTTVAAANCSIDADCDDGNACTDDTCVASVCQYADNTAACDDGVFCNGIDVCVAGTCTPVSNPGVANGTFDGGTSWTSNTPVGGTISYSSNANVVGPDAGTGGFAWSSQSGVMVSGANLEFDLLSYSSSDTGDWDYPVFYLDGTYYGLNSNGTLGAATGGGSGNGGTINNGAPVSSPIHYVVNIDALAGNGGPHTVGFGVHSVDASFGAGTAVYDTVLPAGGPIDPCPGQTCDEVNDVCVP